MESRICFVCGVSVFIIAGMISIMTVKSACKSCERRLRKQVKDNLLKTILSKYEKIMQVNGKVNNSEALINRYLYNYKLMGISVNVLIRIPDLCALFCVIYGMMVGANNYYIYKNKETFLMYIFLGCLAAYILEIINKISNVEDSHRVLLNSIIEFVDNTAAVRYERKSRAIQTEAALAKEEHKVEKESENLVKISRQEQVFTDIINDIFP